jgi:hypothetical protein
LLSTGAYGRDEQGSVAGVAYVFRRTEGNWSLTTQLTAMDGRSSDHFGIATRLSADGTHMAVGAYGDDGSTGSVHLYRRTSTSGTTWERLARVSDPLVSGGNFGYGLSVSEDGTWFIAAAYNSREAAYVFQIYPESADDAADHACPADQLVQLPLPGSPAEFVCDARATFLAPGEADCSAAAQNFTLRSGLPSNESFPAGLTQNVWASGDDARTCSAAVRVVPTLELSTFTAGSNYEFGRRVTVSSDGRFAAVGSHADDLTTTDAGRVFVFERRLGEWVLDAILLQQDWAAYDYFGIDVALSGDGMRLLVGAHGEDDIVGTSGAAYVFERTAGGSWAEVARLKADPPVSSSTFGHTLTLSEDGATAVVGAHDYASSQGRVYVFRRNATDGAWREEAALQPANVANSDIFGYSVAVNADGTRLVAGSRYQDDVRTNDGSVYIFSFNATTGAWEEDAELVPGERNPVFSNSEYFGHDVDMTSAGDLVVVGAYLTDHQYGNSGSAYVFARDANGSWAQTAHLAPPSPAESDEFGHSVTVSGDGGVVAVGARYDDDRTGNGGAVYLFRRSAEDAADYHLEGKLLPPPTSAVYLGTSARLSQDGRVLVAGGTNVERVYSFQLAPDAAMGASSCPADQVVVTPVDEHASCEAAATFADPASSASGASCVAAGAAQTAGLPAGSQFPVGATVNTFRTEAGGGSECSQTVRVVKASRMRVRDGSETVNVGYVVAMSGDARYAIAGGYDGDRGTTNAGVVHLFARSGSSRWTQVATFYEATPSTNDYLGHAVTMSADGVYAAAGAYGDEDRGGDTGSVYVYKRSGEGAAATFGVQAKLYAPDGQIAASDLFGISVRLSGDGSVLLVGASHDDDLGTDTGSIFMYARTGSEWTFTHKLVNPEPGTSDHFGYLKGNSLSDDGLAVAVGVLHDDSPATNSGSAFMYAYDAAAADGAGEWVYEGRLTAPVSRSSDYFGHSTALGGDAASRVAAVGMSQADFAGTNSGAVYMFARDADAGSWAPTSMVYPRAWRSGMQFGIAVELSADGSTLAVGAHVDDSNRGSIHVFRRAAADWSSWTEVARLYAPDATTTWYLGHEVDVSSDGAWVIGGAHAQGTVYAFQLDPEPASEALADWTCAADQLAVLAPPATPAEFQCASAPGEVAFASPLERACTAADAAALNVSQVAGLPSGAAFPVGRTVNRWAAGAEGDARECAADVLVAPSLVITSRRPTANNLFGRAVSVSADGRVAAVGAYHDDATTTDTGRVHTFERRLGEWVPTGELLPLDYAAYDYFGIDVSLNAAGDRLLVGAYQEADAAADSGAAYVFERDPATGVWGERARLKSSTPTASAYFGHSVSLSGDGATAVVGEYGYSGSAGRVYVFRLNGTGDGSWAEMAALQPANVAGGDLFGYDVAVSADGARLVAGSRDAHRAAADEGAAYVFSLNAASGAWEEEAELGLPLSLPYLSADQEFGQSVALSADGERVVVGARLVDLQSPNSGAAYAFSRLANGSWAFDAQLAMPEDGHSGAQLGYSVALSGDGALALVGALYADKDAGDAGAAYLFRRDAATGGWLHVGRLGGAQASTNLGESVALSASGNMALAGGSGTTEQVRSYQLAADATLTRSSCPADVVVVLPVDEPGACAAAAVTFAEPTSCATSLSGGVSLVSGLPSGSDFPLGETVNTYRSADDGSECSFVVRVLKPNHMTSPSPGSDYQYGVYSSMSDDGRYMVVSGYSLDHSGSHLNSGMAWIHARTQDSTWVRQQQLRERSIVQNNYFGHAVDISGDGRYVAIGEYGDDDGTTDTGSAYVWSRVGEGLQATWSMQAKLTAPDRAASDHFGVELALSGDGSLLLVGAYAEETGASNAGSAYIFERRGVSWTWSATLRNPNPGTNDYFGRFVGVSGNGRFLAVSSYSDDDLPGGAVTDAGSVYVFAYNGSDWEQQARLTAPVPRASDYFGYDPAFDDSGTFLVAGAHGRDLVGSYSGSALVYRRENSSWELAAEILDFDSYNDNYMGHGVDISADGTHVLMSGQGGTGAMSIFRRARDDGTAWRRLARVSIPEGLSGAQFGHTSSISADGTWFSTGAYTTYEAVYVFQIYPESADDAADHACPADQLVQLPLPGSPAEFVCDARATFLAPGEADCSAAAQNFTLRSGLPSNESFPAGLTQNVWASGDDARTCSAAVRVVPTLELSTFTAGSNYEFGRRVTVSSDGRFAAVGSHADDLTTTDAGRVFVFERRLGEWVLDAILLQQDWAAYDYFGIDVALSGDGMRLLVGAHGEDDIVGTSGAAYVFERTAGGSWAEVARLKADPPVSSSTFGHTLTLSEDGATAVVGAHDYASSQGRVYVFRRNATDGAWREEAALQPANVANSDIFGYSVAVNADGTRLVAGSRYQDDVRTNDGSVYIFSFNATTGAWEEDAELVPGERNPVFSNSEYFGHDVDMTSAGDLVVVGAYLTDHQYGNSGSAYVFARDANGSWAQTAHLAPPSPAESDEFGHSVTVSGDGGVVAVGARYDDDRTGNGGAVYLFRRSAEDAADYHLEGKLLPPPTSAVYLGTSARLSQDGRVLVAGGTNVERVYSFQLAPDAAMGASSCPADQVVVTPVDEHASCEAAATFADPASSASGASCVAAGAAQTAGLPAGSQFPVGATVNTFRTEAGGGSECSQTVRVVKASRMRVRDGSETVNVGYVVAMSGDARYAIAGGYDGDRGTTNAGVVHLFARSGSSRWTQVATFYEATPSTNDYLGHAVTMSADGVYAAAGAYGDEDRGGDTGSVYVYKRSGEGAAATFGVQAKLYAPDGQIAASDLFGISVRLSGDGSVLLVGASHDDDLGTDTGSIFMYARTGSEWTFTHKLVNPEPGTSDHFGYLKGNSLSDDGLAVAVGVLHDDSPATNSGSAFMYAYDAAAADGAGEWVYEGRLTAPVSRSSDYFGHSTALGGDAASRVAAVGMSQADFAGTNSGAVYMFARDADAGSWAPTSMVYPRAWRSGMQFGIAVELSADGSTLAVGAHVDDSNRGSIHVFRRAAADWSSWTEVARLYAPDATTTWYLGHEVDVSSDGAWVIGGAHAQGTVYAFQLDPEPASEALADWTCAADQLAVLAPPATPAEFQCASAPGEVAFASPLERACTAADAAALNVSQVAGLPSGAAFPVGRTVNRWAAGAEGDARECAADVLVAPSLVITSRRPTANNLFGRAVSVSADGRVAAVGAYHDDATTTDTGRVHTFERRLGEWVPTGELLPLDYAAYDYFGIDVSLNAAGDRLLVGAYQEADAAADSGAAYVFERDPATGVWGERARLKSSTPTASAYFGHSVSLSGDGATAVVGEYGYSGSAGRVYVFRLNGTGDGSWAEMAALQPANVAGGDLFGYDVAVSADGARLVAGSRDAHRAAADEGAAYVFSLNAASGAWEEEAELGLPLSLPYLSADQEFGQSVALSADGERVVVGARLVDLQSPNSGAAYAFSRLANGSWAFDAQLAMPEDGHSGAQLGYSVALSGDGALALVGALYADKDAGDAGAAYLFRRDAATGGWLHVGRLGGAQASTNLGESVALSASGNMALAGGSGTTEQVRSYQLAADATLTRSSCPADVVVVLPVDEPGACAAAAVTFAEPTSCATSLSGGVSLVSGLPSGSDFPLGETVNTYRSADDGSECSFVVRVYKSLKQQGYRPTTDDVYGASVGVSDDGRYMVAGSYASDVANTNTGQVYIYARKGTSEWVLQLQHTMYSPGLSDHFAWGVSISGNGKYAAAGAYLDDDLGTNTGSVTVFVRTGEGLHATWAISAKLYAPDPHTSDHFGLTSDFSFDGSRLMVAAYSHDAGAGDAGALYVFERDGGEWSTGTLLVPVGITSTAHLGHASAMSNDGNYVIAGGHGDDGAGSNAGALHIFHFNGTDWEQQARFVNPRPETNTYLGHRYVGITAGGEFVAVGARDDNLMGADAGATYILRRNGTEWSIATELRLPAYIPSMRFGEVDISSDGTHVVVGAYEDSDGGAGHVFRRLSDDWSAWEYIASLGRTSMTGTSQVGLSPKVSGDGTWVVLGAPGSNEAVFSYQLRPESTAAADWACPADELRVIPVPESPATFSCGVDGGDIATDGSDCVALNGVDCG